MFAGKAGETIKEIINLSRAKVKIHASGNDPEIIVICGKPQCVEHAKVSFYRFIDSSDQLIDYDSFRSSFLLD